MDMADKPGEYETSIQSRIIVEDEYELDGELGESGMIKHSGETSGFYRLYADPLKQGVVWAEVLGPPVCRRKSRGRHGL